MKKLICIILVIGLTGATCCYAQKKKKYPEPVMAGTGGWQTPGKLQTRSLIRHK